MFYSIRGRVVAARNRLPRLVLGHPHRSGRGLGISLYRHCLPRVAHLRLSLYILLVALSLAERAAAEVAVVDDFESYASSTALQAAWVAIAPLSTASVTLDTAGIDGKSMRIAYDVSTGTNAVEITFATDRDYTLKTTIRILYQVIAGSSNEDIVLELRDGSGTVLGKAVAPSGTGVGLAKWEVNLVRGFSRLAAVRKIRLAIKDRGDMIGAGIVLFDDISVTSGTYSTCRSCHGEFIGKPYIALTDGQTWLPDLHEVHSKIMLNSDCKTCHTGPSFFPVFIGSSDGGIGLPGIGCLGCHGREQDQGHDNISSGRAAGLNQHHHRSGVTECVLCHTDADPANYTPVGENIRPAYYFPDVAHPNKPTDPCAASELFVSRTRSLDNDGDLLYNLSDPDCTLPASIPTLGAMAQVALAGLLLVLAAWRMGRLTRGHR